MPIPSEYDEHSSFYRLLDTKYDLSKEEEAMTILSQEPALAILTWPGPDAQGKPFIKGSTALHYAANDGKLKLMERLLSCGADVNASGANWYRSVLSWAANNARIEAIQWLLNHGADPAGFDVLHAAAWGGSSSGSDPNARYDEAIQILIDAGADINDRRNAKKMTPLKAAIESGHQNAITLLQKLGAEQ